MAFSRWLRATSEQYLMIAAQQDIAAKYGIPPPRTPRREGGRGWKGVRGWREVFWLRVYVPAYRAIPWRLRSAIMRRMPGSHRMTWTAGHRPRGPAA
jgi:hypothetical protein